MTRFHKHTLLLNADYSALAICDIYKAFLLVFLEKAEIVNAAEGEYLHTVDKAYPVPSIIKLRRYVNIPYQKVILSKSNIFKRDANQCVYCDTKKDLTLDHVLPRSRGGKSTWKNLVTACQSCNSKKGDRTPEEAQMPMRHQPFRPSFLMMLQNNGLNQNHWLPYLKSS
ncbi:HNH endonuclease [Persicobacter diffluens]|uniref:HNH endonuclease n=1 Tax=Persicobacter diffluens TaxID=981 RepID=A0AAN4W0Y4_9BACT|nr:HNH endonuclease [Persicobacter diffluens]